MYLLFSFVFPSLTMCTHLHPILAETIMEEISNKLESKNLICRLCVSHSDCVRVRVCVCWQTDNRDIWRMKRTPCFRCHLIFFLINWSCNTFLLHPSTLLSHLLFLHPFSSSLCSIYQSLPLSLFHFSPLGCLCVNKLLVFVRDGTLDSLYSSFRENCSDLLSHSLYCAQHTVCY